MNKIIKRILTMAMVAIMVLAMSVPVMAEETPKQTGGKVQIDKELAVDQYAVLPDSGLTFTFVLAENSTDPEITNWPLRSSSGTIDSVTATGVSGAAVSKTGGNITVTFPQSEKNGTQTVESIIKSFILGFDSVTYSQPGLYRYTLTESGSDGNGISYNTEGKTYYIDVYVEYGTPCTIGNIVVTENGTVTNQNPVSDESDDYGSKVDATPNTDDPTPGSSGAKFKNVLAAYDLTITKAVTGNQGERDKTFHFSGSISNVPNGTYHYSVNGGAVQTITASGGTISFSELGITDGQSIVFYDLPYSATYNFSEAEAGNDGYTTTYSDTNGSGTITSAVTVTVTNNKEGTIPTGILMTIAPFAALMLIGVVGVVFIMRKKHYN